MIFQTILLFFIKIKTIFTLFTMIQRFIDKTVRY